MLALQPDLDVLVVPIGGGGLNRRMATAARGLNRKSGSSACRPSAFLDVLRGGKAETAVRPEHHRRRHRGQGTGKLTLPIVRKLSTTSCWSAKAISNRRSGCCSRSRKRLPKARGARAWRALLRHRRRFAGRKVGLVLCGRQTSIRWYCLDHRARHGRARGGCARWRRTARSARRTRQGGRPVWPRPAPTSMKSIIQRTFTHLPVQTTEVEFVLQTRGPRTRGGNHPEAAGIRVQGGCRRTLSLDESSVDPDMAD